MKKLKGLLSGILLICVVLGVFTLSGCESEEVTLKPTEEFFVNDFADVLTEDNRKEILSRGAALQKKTKAQLVVVTVDTVGDNDISEYALNLGREWGVGDEEEDNGIVILLSTEDRLVEVAVGYGLEGALPDSKVGRILDLYGVPYFKADDFSMGIISVYKAIENEIYFEYGLETEENFLPIESITSDPAEEDDSIVTILISWGILILVVFIYFRIFGAKGFLFLGMPHSGFRGGFGGGSSSGSFGGFKGGGGSFGGGGAGRGF